MVIAYDTSSERHVLGRDVNGQSELGFQLYCFVLYAALFMLDVMFQVTDSSTDV